MFKGMGEAASIGVGIIAFTSCALVEMFFPDAWFVSEPKHANLIDLSALYKGGALEKHALKPIYIDDGAGNFVRLVSGDVVFFSPKVLPVMRAALQGKTNSCKIRIKRHANGVKPARFQRATVKVVKGELLIDGVAVQNEDLDRLGVSPDFGYFYTGDDRPCRFHKDIFPDRSSILRIKGSVFLITGGIGSRADCSNTALLYDVAKDETIKKFDLRREKQDHLSLLRSDGKVLLLDGRNSELVDLESGTSEVFDDLVFEKRRCVTACLDGNDDCWIFGGNSNSKTVTSVEKFSPINHTLSRQRELISARATGSSGGHYSSKINAVLMKDGSFLISGGTVWTPKNIYQSRFNSAAEIYRPGKQGKM